MMYCEKRYDHYFKEWENPIDITSTERSGTEIVMTLRTKLNIQEVTEKVSGYAFKIEVSETFPVYKV